jgi:hypothetical protein
MTIKQQGGVFGRNPAFNDVSAATIDATTVDAERLNVTAGADSIATWIQGRSSDNAAAVFFTSNNGGAQYGYVFSNASEFGVSSIGARPLSLGAAGSTAMQIDTSGNANILNGNLIVANGAGIDFSATSGTGTSELFDDYEEGTWTPVVYFGGANTGMSVATTGHYTLVGRLVVVRCSVTFSAKGSSTGTFQIGGLPFVGSINGAGAMGFNYAWATMPTGGVSFIQSSGVIYAMAANNGAYMDDTYFNDVTAINDITIAYMV